MTTEPTALAERIRQQEITRLCHLTPSRNLIHIATGPGIIATATLKIRKRVVFTQQDGERLDRHLSHISCSVEYPNAYYFSKKRNALGEASNFKDWVVLGLKPRSMLRPDTLFCSGNAAGGGGVHLLAGSRGFDAMYTSPVIDSSGRTFIRRDSHLRPCPTNIQAEVMVPEQIPLEDITTIFVPDSAQAARVHAQLEQVGADAGRFGYKIAESFFNASQMSAEIRTGVAPAEIAWNPGD